MTTSGRFWPTPNKADGERGSTTYYRGEGNPTLKGAVLASERFWPTPNAEGGTGYMSGSKRDTWRPTLDGAVKMAPTGPAPVIIAGQGLISSPEDSPASPGLPQESEQAWQMTATSGLNCIGLWFPSGPVGAFLRMCLGSSRWQAGLSGYRLTWKPQATRWGSSLFRLRLSAPTTGGTGSGSSHMMPSPAAQDPGIDASWIVDKDGNPPTHPNQRLYHKVTGRVVQDGLTQYVQMFQPPMPSDVDGGRTTKGKHRQDETGIRKQAMPPTGEKLSARWVCALMGYPEDYLDDLPSDPIGKPASPASRRTK